MTCTHIKTKNKKLFHFFVISKGVQKQSYLILSFIISKLHKKYISIIFSYGIFSFLLVFIVERLGGVLQATLTLNGLIGGITLGLFSLGIFFKSSNKKGALYGGLASLTIVIYIGIMAQLTNEEPEKLPTSLVKCNCNANATSSSMTMQHDQQNDNGGLLQSVFHMSYMWYSLVGACLTMFFGLIISLVTDELAKRQILKLTRKSIEASASQNIASLENGNCKLKNLNNRKNSRNDDIVVHQHNYQNNSDGISIIGEFNQAHRRISKTGIDNPALELGDGDGEALKHTHSL